MKRTVALVLSAGVMAALGGCSSEKSDPAPQTSVTSATATEKPGLPTSFTTPLSTQRIAGVTFATGTYAPSGGSCTYVIRDRVDGEVLTGATITGTASIQLTRYGIAVEGSPSCGTWSRLF